MDITKLNIPVIVVTLLISLAFLTGGRWVYNEYVIVRPLDYKLSESPDVNSAEFDKIDNELVFTVELNSVSNLKKSVNEIKNILSVDSNQSKLLIRDQRNDYLEEVWLKSQFAVHEAAALGNFTDMYKSLVQELQNSQVERWLVDVDQENLYVQLHQGQAYLYEIIPRESVDTGKVLSQPSLITASEVKHIDS